MIVYTEMNYVKNYIKIEQDFVRNLLIFAISNEASVSREDFTSISFNLKTKDEIKLHINSCGFESFGTVDFSVIKRDACVYSRTFGSAFAKELMSIYNQYDAKISLDKLKNIINNSELAKMDLDSSAKFAEINK